MPQPDRYVNVKIQCSSGHDHDICVEIDQQVPKELRCESTASPGYSRGGGGTCTIPPLAELADATKRELRDGFQEAKRRGYVLIRR